MQALPTTRHYMMGASQWQLPCFLIDTAKIALLSIEEQKQLFKEINELISSYVKHEIATKSD